MGHVGHSLFSLKLGPESGQSLKSNFTVMKAHLGSELFSTLYSNPDCIMITGSIFARIMLNVFYQTHLPGLYQTPINGKNVKIV